MQSYCISSLTHTEFVPVTEHLRPLQPSHKYDPSAERRIKSEDQEWVEISNADDKSDIIIRGWSPPPEDPYPIVEIDLERWEAAYSRMPDDQGYARERTTSEPRSRQKRPSRPRPSRAKNVDSVGEPSQGPSHSTFFPFNDPDLDLSVSIPSYIYPQPHLARIITRRVAAENRAYAAYENELLQERFRAEDESRVGAM